MQIVIATPELARAARKLKQLIVTGDDFGRSHEVNEAIERCHEAGFLTQTSLMVNESHAEEAVRIAQRHPSLCVGLHLTLCDGSASTVSALTNTAGKLVPSPARAGLRYAFRPSLAKPLQQEIRAQFARFRACGLVPTYWDGHTHLHLHPTVLRLTLPVAVEHGFRATRLVRESQRGSSLLPAIFSQLSRAALPALQRDGIAFTDHVFGLRHTGKMTTRILSTYLRSLSGGLTEIYFHPGAEPEEIDGVQLRALVDECGITLRTSLPPPSAH